jgi:hypothetical protein
MVCYGYGFNKVHFSVLGSEVLSSRGFLGRDAMQFLMTAMAVLAGLVFSFTVALLVEEFIFAKVFRLFFARPAEVRVKSEQKR